MSRFRPLFLLTALPLVACGGDDGGDDDVTPTGEHYTFVASEVTVPLSSNQGQEFGLDLNDDGVKDNQLAQSLSLLNSQAMINAQTTVTSGVNRGDIILLVDVQTPSFSSSGGTGFQIKFGDKATAQPAPCTDAADTACRKHLTGTGNFTVAASSPTNDALAGKIEGGVFEGGPGKIALQIALSDAPNSALTLNLIAARARLTGISADGVASIIVAGAVTKASIDNEIVPAIFNLANSMSASCVTTATAGKCDCPDPADSEAVTELLDISGPGGTGPEDCKFDLAEVKKNPLLPVLLRPDVTIDGQEALSVGVGAKAVKATF